jgi:fucose permease
VALKIKPGILLTGLAYLSFISLGLPDGLLGVGWPSIRDYFRLPIDAIGPLLVMFTAGYLVSSFSSGRVISRMGVGALLSLSCLLTAASLLGYALTRHWTVMVALGAVAGLGAGAIDAGLNTYAATRFSARVVNWLHAFYGVGATIGPVIMTSLLAAGRPWQAGYAIVAVWQLTLALCFALTLKWWRAPSAEESIEQSTGHSTRQGAAAPARATSACPLGLPAARLSIAVFFLYTGLEAAAGTWAYSLFTESRGVAASGAGLWTSVYWAALTVGRVASGAVIGLVPARFLLRFSIIGLVFGASLVWFNFTDLFGFLGLALMGLSLAPIFPTLIATTPERLGPAHTANAVGFQIAAAVLGQSLLPAGLGLLAGRLGLEVIGPALVASAVLLLALYETLAAVSAKDTAKTVTNSVRDSGAKPRARR